MFQYRSTIICWLGVLLFLSACGSEQPPKTSTGNLDAQPVGSKSKATEYDTSISIFTINQWQSDNNTYRSGIENLRQFSRHIVVANKEQYRWNRGAYMRYWRSSVQPLSLAGKRRVIEKEISALVTVTRSIEMIQDRYGSYYYIDGDPTVRELDPDSKHRLVREKALVENAINEMRAVYRNIL